MADSSYVIGIAANLTGSETVAQLDELTKNMVGAGRSSDDFQAAIRRVSTELNSAKAAADAANAALAAGNSEYASLEKAAISTSKALERAQAKGRFDPRAARAASEAGAALDAYNGKLKGLETEAAKAGAEQARLRKTLDGAKTLSGRTGAAYSDQSRKLRALSRATALLPGPFRELARDALLEARSQHALAGAFGEGVGEQLAFAAAAVGTVVAIAAVTAALVAGYIAFGIYAAKQADAARTARLSREAFAALDPAAKSAAGSFNAVSEATGVADDRLYDLSNQLREAHVSAANMPKALRAAALAEAALGHSGSSEFISRLKDGKDSVDDFARNAQAKFGGIVQRRLLGLDAQTERFKKLWGGLFDGLNLDPVLLGLKTIVDMFDKAHPLAQALSLALNGLFDPIANNAQAAAYAIEGFALGFAIQLTKAYIGAKPFFKAIGVDFPHDSKSFVNAGKLMGQVLTDIATSATIAALGVYALINPIGAGKLVFNMAVAKFKDHGANAAQGMADGINSGAPDAAKAAAQMALDATDAAQAQLGIHSPSKVFAEIGDNTAQGYADGVDAGAPEAQRSMANLTASDGAAAGAGVTPAVLAPTSGGRGPVSVTIERLEISGVDSAASIAPRLAELLTQLLEDDATALAGA